MTNERVDVEARGRAFAIPPSQVFDADARDPGTLLLADTLEIGPGDAALVVGGGSGLVTLVAAQVARSVVVACRQVSAADQVEAALRLNNASIAANVTVVRTGDLRPLRGQTFDVAAISIALAPSTPALRRQMDQAALLLRPGGRLYIAGGNDEGIKSAADHLERLCGNARVLVYRKGHRVVVATRGDEVRADWGAESGATERVTLRGQDFEIGHREGVFAEGRLDEGTGLLAENTEIRSNDTVLDLGCGGGLIGLVAARLAPRGHVTLVDSDVAAVDLARENLERNGIANADALASDGYSALSDERYSVIVTNPPFHQGHYQTAGAARAFIEQAPAHLKRGGRFFLVANRFLKYDPIVQAAFGNVQTVAENAKYRVLRADRVAPSR